MGNLLAITVHAANVHDNAGGMDIYDKAIEVYPSIKGFPVTWAIAEPLLHMLSEPAENVT